MTVSFNGSRRYKEVKFRESRLRGHNNFISQCKEYGGKVFKLLNSRYSNLGSVYAYMREWMKAIENYQRSLEILEKLGDMHSTARTYNNLGSVYYKMGEWNKAIECYQKSLEISEKLGDVHGKGVTLSNLGKLHLDKKPPELEDAQRYLEESIKLLNKEARPHYPNALNWLASCYHSLGSTKKALAKREKDHKKQEELVDLAASLFLGASVRYAQAAALPRLNIPSLGMYAHLDMGLSYSAKNLNEQDEGRAIVLLDNAIAEFKDALKFADEKEKIRLQGIISDHVAKQYIRLIALEENKKKQDILLDKAIEALANAASEFEKLEDGEHCKSSTCEGCMHLFKGLKLFKEGVNEYKQFKIHKALNASIDEIGKARICYEKAKNEIGADTVEILSMSFEFVEKLIKRKDEMFITLAAREFNKIIEELSAVGLRKMVKMYTFDESMNVKKEESGQVLVTGESLLDKLANPASIAAFIFTVIGGVLLYYGYDQYAAASVSVVIGVSLFILFAILKLKKK